MVIHMVHNIKLKILTFKVVDNLIVILHLTVQNSNNHNFNV